MANPPQLWRRTVARKPSPSARPSPLLLATYSISPNHRPGLVKALPLGKQRPAIRETPRRFSARLERCYPNMHSAHDTFPTLCSPAIARIHRCDNRPFHPTVWMCRLQFFSEKEPPWSFQIALSQFPRFCPGAEGTRRHCVVGCRPHYTVSRDHGSRTDERGPTLAASGT